MAITGPAGAPLTRQRLPGEVRRHAERLTRLAERGGIYSRVMADGLARAALQRCLQGECGDGAACHCLVLLACAVHGGAVTPLDVLEQCRELADRSHELALRARHITCARRVVRARIPMESSDGQILA